jgi:hypothetical protein
MDIHHRDIKIAEEHMPTNPAEAEYFKRILLTIDYDDFYDIMNVMRALAQCIKVMTKVMMRALDNRYK